ncbi:hypothetical protein LTR37_016336 [Vermiconidia calcicola]|uniref:Uncharacterized protein n=1 Tax=Vermiconidia calcicola TaxID=1690605 RepID=A0ACC3MNI8_9PEZI|nr:hypothetical protein LTR37_016336 [Vermiconidia calcicola]
MSGTCSVLVKFDWPDRFTKPDERSTDVGDIWSDATFTCDYTDRVLTTLDEVNDYITELVGKRMEKDPGLWEIARLGRNGISYTVEFQIGEYRDGNVVSDSEKIRVQQLEDLFVIPPRGKDVAIHARVVMIMRTDAKAKYWHLKIPELIRDNTGKDDYKYVRVGNAKRRFNVSDSERTPIQCALIARVDTGRRTVQLTLVDYCDFGHIEIGDGRRGQQTLYRRKDFVGRQPFKDARSFKELEQIVLLQASSDFPDIPRWPGMTLNSFMPGEVHSLPDPPVEIDVVVRWVNRLRIANAASLKFKDNQQFISEVDDTYDVTVQHLTKELREHTPDLFRSPLKNCWELELWIMPAWYPTGLKVSNDTLQDFLWKDKADAGDTQLYMEAHIVPKQAQESEAVEQR